MAKRLTPEERKDRDEKEAAEKLERANKRKLATQQRENEKAQEREKEKKERAAERDKKRQEREEQQKAERELTARQRAEARALSEQNRAERAVEEKAEKKANREKARDKRFKLIEDRRAETKTDGRRPKATHFSYTGTGLSKPQALSVRGQVLALIVENCEVGEKYDIEDFAALAEPVLFGTKVRSYLAKLEEMNHIDFHTL